MREALTWSGLLAELLIQRTGDSRILLVVEGDSDIRSLRRRINEQDCRIIAGYSKQAIVKALRHIERKDPDGCIGLVDRDFDDLIHEPTSDNIYMTQLYDREADLLLECNIMYDFIDAGMDENKVARLLSVSCLSSISAIIVRIAAIIGRIRLASMGDEIYLDLSNVPFGGVVIWPAVLDEDKLVRSLVKRSSMSEQDVRAVVVTCMVAEAVDDKRMCRGHDLAKVLAVSSRWWASRKIGYREVENHVGATTRCDVLQTLSWFKDIERWGRRRGKEIWNCVPELREQ